LIDAMLVSALSIVLTATQVPASTTYKVKKGDTIAKIASRHKLTWSQIRKENELTSDKIKPGQLLKIPSSASLTQLASAKRAIAQAKPVLSSPSVKLASNPVVKTTQDYFVKKGDSDWSIARKHDIRVKELRALNPGVDLTKLRPGFRLNVPAAGYQPDFVASASFNSTSSAKPVGKPVQRFERYVMLNANGVRLRKSPSLAAGVSKVIPVSSPCYVLDRRGDWFRVKFPHGSEGWVRQDMLGPLTESGKKALIAAQTAKRKAKQQATRLAELRREAQAEERARASSNRRNVVASKSSKTKAKKTSTGRVAGYSRRTGRSSGLAWTPNEAAEASAILQTAATYRGTPYRYGRSDRNGTDCSGYTTQVFKKHGVKLPRTSSEQSKVGQKVDKNGLKEGDLVFFKTTRGRRVGHVGIYVGNGKFIHASSGGGKVQVNSLSDGYYNRRFVGARRVVKPTAKPAAKTSKPAPKADPKPEPKQEPVKIADPAPTQESGQTQGN
jgi:cell wall-associated NlpC family hydrolase/LysM repeat protein